LDDFAKRMLDRTFDPLIANHRPIRPASDGGEVTSDFHSFACDRAASGYLRFGGPMPDRDKAKYAGACHPWL
jgi:hypothetical protein